MRIALLFVILFFGFHVGSQAIATVNDVQEQRANQLCQIDSNYCKWLLHSITFSLS
jgi:hypothetical protein